MSNITVNNSTSTTNNTSTVSHISNKSGEYAVEPTEEITLLQVLTVKCDILNESAQMTRKTVKVTDL